MDLPCLDLINSDSRGYRDRTRRGDLLDDEEWLKAFLRRWGLDSAGLTTEEARPMLVGLRALLTRMAHTLTEERILLADDIRQFNALLAVSPVVERLIRSDTGYLLDSAPARRDGNWVIAEIARSFGDCLKDPARLKFCANPDCRWVFYDESRNRSRHWCEYECGNVVKVRRFRAKRRAEHGL